MRITPLDVRKQEFRRAVRGFDCDEVRAFLTTLADEYEAVLVDNKQIRERVMAQEDKIAEYKTMERTLRDTLMTAEKLMQETRETANKEGEIIIQGAHQKAKSILEECRMRTEELRREIVGLRKEKETYLARFKGLAEAQIAFVETHKNDFADLDKRLVDMVDSVVDGTMASERDKRQQMRSAAPAPLPIETAGTQETETSVQAAPAAHGSEQDVWRDYNPGQDSHASAPLINAIPAATPQASPEAPTSEPENLVNEVIAESVDQAPEISQPTNQASQQDVELASRGIPVAAIGEPGEGEEKAIIEAISATLTENPTGAAVPQQ
jgi:cell division initiation protein